jgi:DNA (cytosine-5)-methyltransferase 1
MQLNLDVHDEIIIDNFAGGGGASAGIELAIGRRIDVAINHDPEAVALHTANHPETEHHCESVWEVDPRTVKPGRPIGLLWLSPDCKHFSKAKGGKPVEKKIRGLAWVALRWVALRRPRVLMLENVEEFVTWGPLGSDGRPCPKNKGREFNAFRNALQRHGYQVEWKEMRACDFGAPTIRKRLFLIARCDGQPITWPAATHGDPKSAAVKTRKLKPWRTAAECIDWTLPTPSIFDRTRPLADATCRRIAKGIMRYVVNAAQPFIVNTRNGERQGQQPRVRSIDEPFWTVTAQGSQHALVSAFLAKHYGGVVGSELQAPIGMVTSVDHHSLVAANLVHVGHGEGKDGGKRFSHGVRDITQPLNTITANGATAGLVKAFMVKYYGNEQDGVEMGEPMHTVTSRDRFGLVTVAGEEYQIADIGLRMLAPRELYRAQGFPEGYIIDYGVTPTGQRIPLTKTAQVRMCGNSVCPPMAQALVAANLGELSIRRAA